MKRMIGVAVLGAALLVPAVAAQASYTTVQCWNSWGGEYQMRLLAKPRTCMFNGSKAHGYQVPIKNMRWRSWGGRVAVGRGTAFYNMGYRAPIRFRLYRRQGWDHGLLVYTRLRGTVYDRSRGAIRVRSQL